MILEACVGNLKDALSAQNKGAHQIELCGRLDLDGNTPSLEMIEEVVSVLDIPLKVIVNPKPFDYSYSHNELIEITRYISAASKFNIKGLVFGPVNKKGMPDLDSIKHISKYTDLPITYHKAIDDSPDILKALQLLIDQDIIKYILTSGGAKTAEGGVDIIMRMNEIIKQRKSQIQLIGAGRIIKDNISSLHKLLNLKCYHGKLIVGEL